jgi:hypothetical protein
MSIYFKQIQEALSKKPSEQITTGVVQSVHKNQLIVQLQDGRTRTCWGNAAVGNSVIVQNDQIIGRGKVGKIKTYQV